LAFAIISRRLRLRFDFARVDKDMNLVFVSH